jgi:hypothetical protein
MVRKNKLRKSRKPRKLTLKKIAKKDNKSRKNKNAFMKRTFKKMFKGGMIPPHILNRYTKNDSDSDTDSEGPAPQPKMTESELSLERSKYYNTPLSLIVPKGEKQLIIPHSGVVGYKNLPVEGEIEEVDMSDDEWFLPARKPGQLRHVNPLPPGYNVEKDAKRAFKYAESMKKKHKLDKKTLEEARKNLDFYEKGHLEDQIDEHESEMEKRSLDYTKFVPEAMKNIPLGQHFGKYKNTTVTARKNIPDIEDVPTEDMIVLPFRKKLKNRFNKTLKKVSSSLNKTLKRKPKIPDSDSDPDLEWLDA